MKKYRVTEKHPVYRSGLRIEQKHDNCFHLLGTENELYLNAVRSIINIWLNNKWIEEVRKPLFTTEDAIDMYINDEVWILENNYVFSVKVKQPEKDYYSILNTLEKCKAFSTKEAAKRYAAERYIDQTPKFTKDDMADSFHAGTIYNHRINAGFMPVVPFEKWIKKSKK